MVVTMMRRMKRLGMQMKLAPIQGVTDLTAEKYVIGQETKFKRIVNSGLSLVIEKLT